MMMQGAGFEPANRLGLGPKPSAVDQAWQPLLDLRSSTHRLECSDWVRRCGNGQMLRLEATRYMSKIAILGLGNWGTALAHCWANDSHKVMGWTVEEEVYGSIMETGENAKYLPGMQLNIDVTIVIFALIAVIILTTVQLSVLIRSLLLSAIFPPSCHAILLLNLFIFSS